ncbi:MAG: PD-(D/E)XK nuclease family protein [Rhodobacteraceae bacterium]|nr:PD-(D/E)XK nuclease family protein [Paracoccaceae bacterium]
MNENLDALFEDDSFCDLEKMLNVFCPFEAVGMASQEIRHAHYLAYILNPNKPHGFGIKLLNAFLRLALVKEIPASSDAKYESVKIIRERDNIDLRIEIPAPTLQEKAIVLVIELKINAVEDAKQLKKYHGIVNRQYRDKDWDKRYIFLTKQGTAARNTKDQENWKPMALAKLIPEFETELKNQNPSQSFDFFRANIGMMRRKHLGDKEIRQKVAEIWDRHSDALEKLIKYQPDRAGDIMQYLVANDELLAKLKEDQPLEIRKTKSSHKILRFHIKAWDCLRGMKAETSRWVDSQSIIVIEIYKGRPKGLPRDIRITYCLDHSGNLDKAAEKNREAIYKKSTDLKLLKWVDPDWTIPSYTNNYIHLHKAVLWPWDERKSYSEFINNIEDIAKLIIENAHEFLTHTLLHYDKIIREASLETTEHNNAVPEGEANTV